MIYTILQLSPPGCQVVRPLAFPLRKGPLVCTATPKPWMRRIIGDPWKNSAAEHFARLVELVA